MAADLHSLVHLIFISVVALFPVINPVGTAFVVMPYLSQLDSIGKARAVRLITFYAFCVCTVTLLLGHWILSLFGLSIPVVQLAGGIIICRSGWQLLGAGNEPRRESAAGTDTSQLAIEDQLFFPLTFPLTAGAGTVSVLLTLSAHAANADVGAQLLNMGAIEVAVVCMCALVYFFYSNTQRIQRYLGTRGEAIFNRLIAFFIFCVGLQIATTGAKVLFTS
ncbi:MarC family protein [Variovorax sp.]|uniref:MarC family protein n=1 Tax=Variovorax sp. TaxID=1871043 RepID=UPI002D27BBD4|nr:MarC family protein [Variovorax sp.]HYP85298.1 MarC family protein [Variovorax sp.]